VSVTNGYSRKIWKKKKKSLFELLSRYFSGQMGKSQKSAQRSELII